MEQYSFVTTLKKGLKYFILFILPVLIDKFVVAYPQVAQLTVGAVLVMLANFLKAKYGVRMPFID